MKNENQQENSFSEEDIVSEKKQDEKQVETGELKGEANEAKKEEKTDKKSGDKESRKKEYCQNKKCEKKTEGASFTYFWALFFMMLGFIFLGGSMGFWNLDTAFSIFGPLILMLLGLFLIANRSVVRFLVVTLSIFVSVIVVIVLLNIFAKSSPVYRRVVDSEPKEMMQKMERVYDYYQTRIFQNDQGDFSTSFSGNLNKVEAQAKFNQVLDLIYSNPHKRVNIEVDVEVDRR